MTGTRFFVFSDKPDEKEAITLLRLGSVGYANTYISPVRLKEAVNIVLAGRVWVGQKLMLSIIRDSTKGIDEQGLDTLPSHTLSEREWEVALLVSKGRSNLEIAASLNLSARTVETHKYQMMQALGVESTAELVKYAIEHRLTEK
jgi:DNA-binding NarL/FixJ family response regulator